MRIEVLAPRFAGRRIIVAATGPSLTPEIAELCRDEIVIAVSDAHRLIPWAVAMYSCDSRWWKHYNGCPEFAGERWTSHSLRPANDKRELAGRYGLRVVAGAEKSTFSTDPSVIHYGRNSGFQAVNMALLWGGNPVVLIGFDMHGSHFFGEHPPPVVRRRTQFGAFIAAFTHAAQALPPGQRIINATPGSALPCFPIVPLGKFLRHERMAA